MPKTMSVVERSMVVREKGMPVEIALRQAFAKNSLPDERLGELQNELYDLVGEVTVKFVGFFATKSVKQGLTITLRVISFGLEAATNGDYEPDNWVKEVGRTGFKGLVTKVLALLKELSVLPQVDTFVNRERGIGFKELLTEALRQRGSLYGWYKGRLDAGLRSRDEIELGLFLVRTVTRRDPGIWVREMDKQSSPPLATSIINTFMLRVCLGLPPKLHITYSEVQTAYKALTALKKKTNGTEKKKWVRAAHKRYAAFISTLDEKYQGHFRRSDSADWWFSNMFEGAFAEVNKRAGAEYFHIVAIPPNVQDKMARESLGY